MAILISYHEDNARFAEIWLTPFLEKAGYEVVTFEADARVGANALAERERLVKAAERMIAVISPEYLAGKWTAFDADLAQHLDPAARDAKLLPIVLQATDLPPRLQALKSLDFSDPIMWAEKGKNLLNALNGHAWEDDERRENEMATQPMDREREADKRMTAMEAELTILKSAIMGNEALGYKGFRGEIRDFQRTVNILMIVLFGNILATVGGILWNIFLMAR